MNGEKKQYCLLISTWPGFVKYTLLSRAIYGTSAIKPNRAIWLANLAMVIKNVRSTKHNANIAGGGNASFYKNVHKNISNVFPHILGTFLSFKIINQKKQSLSLHFNIISL